MVDVNRDELAYKSEVKLTGYCNAKNDENNNLWVTMESPFLTKKITQKFPTLPGYTIPETRAIGDNEIEITSNGNYILGQNDEDPDDLEMDIDNNNNNNNNNNSKKLTLLKNQTRDNITSNFILGKININIPSPVYPEITFNTITQNDTYYTLSELTNDQSEYFSKNSKIKCQTNQTKIIIDELYSGTYNWANKMISSWKSTQTSVYLYQYQEMIYIHLDSKNKIWHIEWSSQNKGGYTKTFAANSYVAVGDYSNAFWLWFRNSAIPNVNLLSLYDPLPGAQYGEGTQSETLMELSTDYFDFAWPRT